MLAQWLTKKLKNGTSYRKGCRPLDFSIYSFKHLKDLRIFKKKIRLVGEVALQQSTVQTNVN